MSLKAFTFPFKKDGFRLKCPFFLTSNQLQGPCMDVQAQFPETRREDCRRMSSADLRQKRWRGQSRLFLPRRPRPAKCFPASGLDGRCCAERMILLRKCFVGSVSESETQARVIGHHWQLGRVLCTVERCWPYKQLCLFSLS